MSRVVLAMQSLDQFGDQSSPASLMARPQTTPALAMKVLVEQQQVSPGGIILISRIFAVTRSLAVRILQKQTDLSAHQFFRNFAQRHPRAGTHGALNAKIITVEFAIPFERLNQQIVQWKPDRTAPVTVASEHC